MRNERKKMQRKIMEKKYEFIYIFHKNIMLHLFMKKPKKVKKMGQKEKHSERN